MTKVNQDFEMWAGEDKTLNGMVYQSDGVTAQDITGPTIAWVLKTGPQALTNVLSKAGVIVSAVGGTYTITLADTDTSALVGTYWHYAELTDAIGNNTKITEGWCTFYPTRTYATLAQLKAEISLLETDTVDDSKLIMGLDAASRAVEEDCGGRRFYTTSADETAYFTAVRSDRLFLEGDFEKDLISITTLATDSDGDRTYEDIWAVSDYDLTPFNAGINTKPYSGIQVTPSGNYYFPVGVERGVKVVGKFGYRASTPIQITQATLFLASRMFRRKDAPLGVVGSPDFGMIRVSRFDPDYEKLIWPFKALRAV